MTPLPLLRHGIGDFVQPVPHDIRDSSECYASSMSTTKQNDEETTVEDVKDTCAQFTEELAEVLRDPAIVALAEKFENEWEARGIPKGLREEKSMLGYAMTRLLQADCSLELLFEYMRSCSEFSLKLEEK